ncbi:MAG: hypothetical protein Kow0077_23500 [Anaerolineae bacterium]
MRWIEPRREFRHARTFAPSYRKYTTPGRIAIGAVSALALLLLTLPLIVLAWEALAGRGWQTTSAAQVLQAVGLSLLTTLISAVLIILLGTPLAYVLARWPVPLHRAITVLIELPIVLPPAVAGLALLMTFGRQGFAGPLLARFGISIPFTTAAVVLAQVFVAAPLFIRSAQVGFAAVDPAVEEAAQVDGADGLTKFWRITLPLAAPGLAAGLVLSWARALGEFGATILFAGSLPGRTQTMPLLVYSAFERDLNAALWTALILIGLALAALVLSRWLVGRQSPI